jgi:deoxyribonuclease V
MDETAVECRVLAPYRPGEFYLRELPPILTALSRSAWTLEIIVVDGYVWLGPARPGLGARLYAALGRKTPVVGVAKTPWRVGPASRERRPDRAVAVKRGASAKPLYVTAVGVDVLAAAALVESMHGKHRIPTLLRTVDRLTRQRAPAAA